MFNDLKKGLEQAIEIEKCKFCKDIPIYNKEYSKKRWHEKCSGLMKKESGEIIYYIAVDDDYYNHIAIDNVKYCPCCGRELE